jgi:hypothetical protein
VDQPDTGRFADLRHADHIHTPIPVPPASSTDSGSCASSTIPRIFGLATLVLPFAVWATVRKTWQTSRTADSPDESSQDLVLLLAVWVALPAILLSLSANKETSYILPSCAAAALLAAWWLDERFLPNDPLQWRDIQWFGFILYHPDDIARGCVPFYHNRLAPEIDHPNELQWTLASDRKVFVLMRTQVLDRLQAAKVVASSWLLQPLPDLDDHHRYVLISNVP